MSEVRLDRATPEAIQFIADNMRKEDAVEVDALGGYTPLKALEHSLEHSIRHAVVYAGDMPLTALGLIRPNLLSPVGVPWLLSANQALQHRSQFLALSPQVINEMLTICPKLVNCVHSENKLSIRWLKWLGFTVEDAIPIGINGAMFHPFHKEK